jgi:hypothetical protein
LVIAVLGMVDSAKEEKARRLCGGQEMSASV